MPISPDLLGLLVCPVPDCRGALSATADALACSGCGRVYPVQEGWPVLIPEEAQRPASREE